jgi:hypothetical protein
MPSSHPSGTVKLLVPEFEYEPTVCWEPFVVLIHLQLTVELEVILSILIVAEDLVAK